MQRQFDDLLPGSIELFCLAAELGSFTAAATAASVTPAAVSRAVAGLEKRLGVRLFVRTTRHIRLTDPGRRYFEQCQAALRQLADAECEATEQQVTPAGVLRISMPTPYGHYRVLPILAYGASGDVLAGVTMARHGAGVFQTYRFVVEKDFAEGTLKELLKPSGGTSRPFILLYPHGRHVSSRMRSFVDFLMDKLGTQNARLANHAI